MTSRPERYTQFLACVEVFKENTEASKIWDKHFSWCCVGGQSIATADSHCLPDKELSHSCILLSANFGNCFLFVCLFFHPIAPISNSLKEDCLKGFVWEGQLKQDDLKTYVKLMLMQMLLVVGWCVKRKPRKTTRKTQNKPKTENKTKQQNKTTV